MKITKFALILFTSGLLALFAFTGVQASEQIGAIEGIKCVKCHDKPGSKLLTDRGKYYESVGTLDGFAEMNSTFGRCTHCHVRRPGSKKLTKKGQRLAAVFQDMEELRHWVQERHGPLSGGELPPEEE